MDHLFERVEELTSSNTRLVAKYKRLKSEVSAISSGQKTHDKQLEAMQHRLDATHVDIISRLDRLAIHAAVQPQPVPQNEAGAMPLIGTIVSMGTAIVCSAFKWYSNKKVTSLSFSLH